MNSIYKAKLNKQTYNISKSVLYSLISPIDLCIDKKTIVDTSLCSNCVFSSTDNIYADNYCNNYCSCKKVKYSFRKDFKSKYLLNKLEENNLTGIAADTITNKTTIKLSNLNIRLMLLFYSLCDKNGVIKELKKRDIANILNCNIRTLKNNLNILQDLNYITLANKSYGKVSLLINNYHEQYQKNGDGYIVLSNTMMKILLESPSVHISIILIKALLKFDMNHKTNKETFITIEELKKLCPSIAFSAAIKKLLLKLNHFLISIRKKLNINSDIFIFKLLDYNDTIKLQFQLYLDYDGKTLKASIKTDTTDYLKDLEAKNILPKKIKSNANDFIALACEYGLDKVQNVTRLITEDGFDTIKNLGAYIRMSIIEEF